jgi:hypothetical protein
MEDDMIKKYYELVFEGNYDLICGMIEGFLLGKGAGWEWYSSKESGIETEAFTEIIKEWASLKTRLHHIILEEEFHYELQKTLKEKGDLRYIKLKYTKSAREIKSCSFKFTANAYAKKYGEEIKEIISKPPAGVKIENYNPVEEVDASVKGVELYAPVHDYSFKGSGTATGEFGGIVSFRKILNDHPLVQVSSIKLNF